MSDEIQALIKKAKAGDHLSLGRLLTRLEQEGAQALSVPELRAPKGRAFRIGITGPPGAGKSTLVGQLLLRLKSKGLKIGVLAVDPSSPFSKGAILGDRIRYGEYANEENIFIRSLGTRGSLGGLSSSTYLMLRAFDACEFDLVLIETVGVGQTELEVMSVADEIVVVLVPESGDSIQAMKAGLLEIATYFVVNKSDRPGADAIFNELTAMSTLVPLGQETKAVEVFKVIASQGEGVEELLNKLMAIFKAKSFLQKSSSLERLRAETKSLLRAKAEAAIERQIAVAKTSAELLELLTKN